MRMVCPNCGAQYEIADDVIPESGRDVQCSNCGHTWFENRGDSENDEKQDAFVVDDEMDAEPVYEDETPSEEATDAPDPEEKIAHQRQQLDTSIADILKEEAAREAEVRATEQVETLEGQPELGLDEGIAAAPSEEESRAEETRRRVARMKGEEVAEAETAASRKDLLPDIEEINSSLRSNAERGDSVAAEEEHIERRRGFRFGFSTILAIFALLAALYIFAPKIIEMVPQTEGVLTGYVDMVDNARLWLDLKMQGLTASMEQSGNG